MMNRRRRKSKQAPLDTQIKELEEKLDGLKLKKKKLEPKPKTYSRKDFRKMKERAQLFNKIRGL